jgi:light-regulated signal transduction histidine kinase (bacteriophytochrome)
MSNVPRNLLERYAVALKSHFTGPDDSALTRAYELGRAALNDGLGVLDMATLHAEALRLAAVEGSPATKPADADKAVEFFIESLSPFEMSLQGYRESNARLMAMNEALDQARIGTEAANRELESFSYSVAHDLRAPLRSIDGFSQALLEDYGEKLDDEARQYLRYLRESAQQMAQLIDDLLNLSRLARSELKREMVDLSALARDVVAKLSQREPGRQVAVTVQDGMTARGDQRLLRVVLENLLGNAWKFTGKRADATIVFGTAAIDGMVTYFIRDNGAGFDMAYADKLFGVFQRLHSGHEFEGTGVGLATVQRIVRRHGGSIRAEGAIDRGATFSFDLGEKVFGANRT